MSEENKVNICIREQVYVSSRCEQMCYGFDIDRSGV